MAKKKPRKREVKKSPTKRSVNELPLKRKKAAPKKGSRSAKGTKKGIQGRNKGIDGPRHEKTNRKASRVSTDAPTLEQLLERAKQQGEKLLSSPEKSTNLGSTEGIRHAEDPNRKVEVDGQRRSLSNAKKNRWNKDRANEDYQGRAAHTNRDIATVADFMPFEPLALDQINWERRMQCKADPLLDLQTYMPAVFHLGWADFHRGLIHEIEDRIQEGGKKSFGCPRGTGKTAISRGMIIRATKYALRNFAFFIGSKEDKAVQTLDFIKTYWYRSPLLQKDFPEIGYPVYRIEGRSSIGVHGQVYKDYRTHIIWSSKEVQYPCMLFEEEDMAGPHVHGPESERVGHLSRDPDSIIYLPDIGIDIKRFISKAAGTIIRVAGIDGSIRGEADIHPVLLTQPRPDLVLLDDVQKEQKADSPKSCEDLSKLIEAAIDYLAAPDVTQATLMPCTVIREGDVSDTYLDPAKKPEWDGERHGIINRYPDGISDSVILDEINGIPNPIGKLWIDYREIREKSYRQCKSLKLANEFYRTHREDMDRGFEISWEQRYKQDTKNPDKDEVSAIQAAMNWRFKDLQSFLSEGQNRPVGNVDTTGLLVSPGEIAEHITEIPHQEVSSQWTNLVAFIDVQEEILFYSVFASDVNFNGQFIDYGTFPQLKTRYFRKNQTYGWSLLTRLFYKEYPQQRPEKGMYQNRNTTVRAPFDEKIYLALTQCVSWLFKRRFPSHSGRTVSIRKIGIDTQWGKSTDVIKKYIREQRNHNILAYHGNAFQPSYKQLEEYEAREGWTFEHELHPHTKESMWVVKPYDNSDGFYILADSNRLKSFLMKRLATPVGGKASVTLYQADPDHHRMFADQLGASEYPEPITARGMTKDCWKPKPNLKTENDYLDTAAGCMCLASICGASIKLNEDEENRAKRKKRRSIKDAYRQKQRRSA